MKVQLYSFFYNFLINTIIKTNNLLSQYISNRNNKTFLEYQLYLSEQLKRLQLTEIRYALKSEWKRNEIVQGLRFIFILFVSDT